MRKQHWQDWGTAIIGAWVFVSPWFLHTNPGGTLTTGAGLSMVWSAWFSGILLMVLSLSELSSFSRVKEWCIAALGAWLFIAPQVLGYPHVDRSVLNSLIVGLATLALSGWAIGDAHELLPKVRRAKGDMRNNLPQMGLADEHEHLAGEPQPHMSGPDILRPGTGIGVPGQVTKSS